MGGTDAVYARLLGGESENAIAATVESYRKWLESGAPWAGAESAETAESA